MDFCGVNGVVLQDLQNVSINVMEAILDLLP